MHDALTLQKKLLSVVGIAGFEENRARLIAEMVRPLCDEVTVDAMFNVIAHKKGPGKRVMTSAHADTIGFLVTHIEDKGYVRFATMGGISPVQAVDTLVRFENGALGRVSAVRCSGDKARALGEVRTDDLCIDLGVHSREEASRLVRIGEIGHYAGEPRIIGDDVLMSPYLDDLIACVIQIQVLQRMEGKWSPNDVYFVFSTQEEVGHRGAKAAAHAIRAQYGIALDVTRTGDVRESATYMEVSMGGGAAIKVKDSGVICTPEVVRMLKETAVANHIPYQIEVLESGGTDTEAIQHNRSGAPAGGISIPSRYTHSPLEMVSLRDVNACVELLQAVLTKNL
jgi:putative aminopeptidase FrvX